jgi:arylsulfatase A-like enzyme
MANLWMALATFAAALAWSPASTAQSDKAPAQRAETDRPNIVLILADDLGYGGLRVQGDNEAVTPHIDALAAAGARFTDFYANHPVCSPTRAALMTGKYSHRMGFEHNSGSPQATSPRFGVPAAELTVAERLKARGYATGMFGKWHIGFAPDRTPTAQGFDTFYGFLAGAHGYTPRSDRARPGRVDGFGGGQTILRGTTSEPMPAHLTEAFAEEAVRFIDANRSRPFFVYLPFNAVHSPMEATEAYLARFAHVADPLRRTHLAQLAAMDDAVGRVVAAVDGAGLGRRTLILFMSDNGGPTQETTSSNRPLKGVKGTMLEGGIRVPAIARWTGRIPAGRTVVAPAMGFDFTATALAAAGAAPRSGLDGVDLAPWLTGAKTGAVHEAMFWRSGDQAAVRSGDWKLLRNGERRYLFNLARDIGETRDLSATEPGRVKALDARFAAWSAQMQPPAWVRNELTGGDRRDPAQMQARIDALVRGQSAEVDDID